MSVVQKRADMSSTRSFFHRLLSEGSHRGEIVLVQIRDTRMEGVYGKNDGLVSRHHGLVREMGGGEGKGDGGGGIGETGE